MTPLRMFILSVIIGLLVGSGIGLSLRLAFGPAGTIGPTDTTTPIPSRPPMILP